MNDDPTYPDTPDDEGETSPGQKVHATAQRPSDHLDKERESTETIPRKSSLL